MKVLGFESSCDETGVALVETRPDGPPRLLAEALHSQAAMHAAYGGVVPELASRDHIRRVLRWRARYWPRPPANCRRWTWWPTRVARAWRRVAGGGRRRGGAGRRARQAGAGRSPPRRAPVVAVPRRRSAGFPLRGAAGVGRTHAADAGRRRRPLHAAGRDHRRRRGRGLRQECQAHGPGYPGGPALARLADFGNPDAFALPRRSCTAATWISPLPA